MSPMIRVGEDGIRPSCVQIFMTHVALRMHSSFEKQTMSIEKRYRFDSLWVYLHSANNCAFL